jgi:hypothetical protein
LLLLESIKPPSKWGEALRYRCSFFLLLRVNRLAYVLR